MMITAEGVSWVIFHSKAAKTMLVIETNKETKMSICSPCLPWCYLMLLLLVLLLFLGCKEFQLLRRLLVRSYGIFLVLLCFYYRCLLLLLLLLPMSFKAVALFLLLLYITFVVVGGVVAAAFWQFSSSWYFGATIEIQPSIRQSTDVAIKETDVPTKRHRHQRSVQPTVTTISDEEEPSQKTRIYCKKKNTSVFERDDFRRQCASVCV